MAQPSVIVFDVNETLSDMSPMADRFAELGVAGPMAKQWFASVLRDGFALTSTGERPLFADLAAEAARVLLSEVPLNQGLEDAVQHIVQGMTGLTLHPDVADGVRDLRRGSEPGAGLRLVTLSNGPARIAENLLTTAGLRTEFDHVLSVEDAEGWKPLPTAYQYASTVCGVPLDAMLLVAVHPWDIHGASSAGMQTAWLNRTGGAYPSYFAAPDHEVATLSELAARLKAS